MSEPVDCTLNLRVAEVAYASALRETLPVQPIGVLVEAELPRALGLGKVDVRLECSAKLLMQNKLRAIVQRDGVATVCMGPQYLLDGLTGGLRAAPGNWVSLGVEGLALDQCHQATPVPASHDGVAHPITDPRFGMRHRWALFNAHPVLNLETAVERARVGCHGVVWVGATTRWARARKAEQRPQAARGRLNRVRSALTQKVNKFVAKNFNHDNILLAVIGGQLRFLG